MKPDLKSMLRAGCQELTWAVDIRRGQLEGVALEDHRKEDFRFCRHEAHPDARSRSKAEGDEHNCIVVGSLSYAF